MCITMYYCYIYIYDICIVGDFCPFMIVLEQTNWFILLEGSSHELQPVGNIKFLNVLSTVQWHIYI